MTDREMDALKRRLKSYVKEREENYIKWLKKQDIEVSERVKQILKRTSDEILKETTRLMLQFADANGNISPAQMSLLVGDADMQYLAEKAKHYVELANRKNAYAFSPEANAEMKQYNWTMKVSRQELLRRHLNLEISKMTKEVEGTLSTYLEDLTVKELQRQAGILNFTISDSESLLNKARVIANADFYGQTFSERLWNNSEQLMQKLELGVSETMLMGKNPKAWSKMFRKELKDNVKNAKQVIDRLAVTEAGRVQIMAQEDSYKRNNFSMYEIITEPDACEICLEHNGQVYNTEDLQIGLNAPVWHPNCRCTTTPYVSEEDVEEAISKLESYRNMTDEELYQELMAKGKIKEYALFENKTNYMGKRESFEAKFKDNKVKFKAHEFEGMQGVYIQDYSKETKKLINYLKENTELLDNKPSKIVITNVHDAPFGAYDWEKDIMYLNKIISSDSFKYKLEGDYYASENINNVVNHELTHKIYWDRVKELYNRDKKRYNNLIDTENILIEKFRVYIKQQMSTDPLYIAKNISGYAEEMYLRKRKYREVFAEAVVKIENGSLYDGNLENIIREIIDNANDTR